MRTTTARLRLALLPVLVAGLLGLAACGASAQSTSGTSGGGTDALAACLAENGVTMPAEAPGGGTPPGGGAPPTGSAAPTGAPSAGGDQAGGGQGGSPAAPPGVDATTWAAAQKACASLAPTPPAASS